MPVKSKYDIILVRASKWHYHRPYVRAPPSHIWNPSPAQLDVRIKFGEIAMKAKGKKGLEPITGLPWAAYYVKKYLKGYISPAPRREKPLPKWLQNLLEYLQLIGYTMEDIKRMNLIEKLKTIAQGLAEFYDLTTRV